MNSINNQLDRFLQNHLDNYIQETAQLCAHPSVSTRKEGVLECAELVMQILERHGLIFQKTSQRDALLTARWGEK